jgi:DNA polymerase III beta subunit-like protein
MEILVRTTDFARVLRLAQTLTDRKNTMPVLGTLLIRADAKALTVTGMDMELGGISYCPATIRAPGSVAIPAQRLAEYVPMLPDSELVLKAQTGGCVSLSCGRSRSRIATISAESFPELPKPARDGASLFERRTDAERFLHEFPGPIGEVRFGITFGQDQTDRVRAVRCSKPNAAWREKAETFTFLGFTH